MRPGVTIASAERAPRRYGPRVARWEGDTEWPLAAIAVLFLAAYAWPILDTHVSPAWRSLCRAVDYTTWVVFAVDYVVRVSLAVPRRRYWLRHLPDLLVVALPILRPLRLLRLLLLLRALNRRLADSLRGRVAVYVGGATVLLVFCASLAILDAERNAPGSNIRDFPDAIWWATATVCTVGYGDRYPVTGEGRAVATGLMLGGIALLGVVTASFAAWLIETVRDIEEDAQAVTRRDLTAVLHRLDDVSARLDAITGHLALGGDPQVASGLRLDGQPQPEADQH